MIRDRIIKTKNQTKDKVKNAHDLFTKKMLGNKNNAKAFLKDYLPKELVNIIDFSTLKVLKDTFVSEELKEYYTDLLFKFKVKNEETLFYILFEHKSYNDKSIIIQLLKYQVMIYEKYTEDHTDWETLPPIIPFVLYHGEENWTIKKSFTDFLNITNPLIRDYAISFRYILCNLNDIPDEEIKSKGNSIVALSLYILKHIFDKDDILKNIFPKDVVDLIRKANAESKTGGFFKTLTKYLINYIEKELLHSTLRQSLEQQGEKIYMTALEEIKQEVYSTALENIRTEEKVQIAKNMLKHNEEIEYIAEITELSIEEIKKLKREIS